MKYKMYDEMMEQPDSLRKTFESEMPKLEEVSKLISENSSGTVLGRLYPSWWKMTTGENGAKDTAVFKNPAYYISSLYMGYGKTDNAVYQKAVNNTIEVLGGKINISPYQNSINNVLW